MLKDVLWCVMVDGQTRNRRIVGRAHIHWMSWAVVIFSVAVDSSNQPNGNRTSTHSARTVCMTTRERCSTGSAARSTKPSPCSPMSVSSAWVWWGMLWVSELKGLIGRRERHASRAIRSKQGLLVWVQTHTLRLCEGGVQKQEQQQQERKQHQTR